MSPRWQNASRYSALSLTERLAALHKAANEISCDNSKKERALQRLQAWKTQKPFDQGTLFAERLATDGMTEDDLFILLAELRCQPR
jgi:hypothetical protein